MFVLRILLNPPKFKKYFLFGITYICCICLNPFWRPHLKVDHQCLLLSWNQKVSLQVLFRFHPSCYLDLVDSLLLDHVELIHHNSHHFSWCLKRPLLLYKQRHWQASQNQQLQRKTNFPKYCYPHFVNRMMLWDWHLGRLVQKLMRVSKL